MARKPAFSPLAQIVGDFPRAKDLQLSGPMPPYLQPFRCSLLHCQPLYPHIWLHPTVPCASNLLLQALHASSLCNDLSSCLADCSSLFPAAYSNTAHGLYAAHWIVALSIGLPPVFLAIPNGHPCYISTVSPIGCMIVRDSYVSIQNTWNGTRHPFYL